MKKQNNQGITLIALVITIIVLLILAGVSLRLVAGDEGILGRAEKAVSKNNTASLQEEIELAIAETTMEFYEERPTEASSAKEYVAYKLNPENGGIKTSNGKVTSAGGKLTYTSTDKKTTATGTYNATTGSVTMDETGAGEMTLAAVTNDNIGDYIDLGNNIVGTSATTDDWRIFYKEGNNVYAILADYLPNDTGYAASAGLETYGTYNVDGDLINAFGHTTAWNGLANGVSGATVTGTPTYELLRKSWNSNSKVNSSKTFMDYPVRGWDWEDATGLYSPHSESVDSCKGYWVTWIGTAMDGYNLLWRMNFGMSFCDSGDDDGLLSARPIVSMPVNTAVGFDSAELLWTVKK